MRNEQTSNGLYDSVDPKGPFDAVQCAIHGLLSVHFEVESGLCAKRADAFLERLAAEREDSSLLGRRRVVWPLLGMTAAAVIGLVLLPDTTFHATPTALARQLQQVGFDNLILAPANLLDPADDEAIRGVEETIVNAILRRDQMLEAGDNGEAMFAWAKVYRNLRALGRWYEALSEMKDALAFSSAEHETQSKAGHGGFSYFYVCLTDLGDTYASLGNLERALDYHVRSLNLAVEYEKWLFADRSMPDKGLKARAGSLANTIAPRYWRLSNLSAAGGDLDAARAYHFEAGALLVDVFRQECEAREIRVAGDASLHDLCAAVVDNAEPSLGSLIVKVRDHLVREARLLRLGRQLDSASEMLHLAKSIPYSAWRDESRLTFAEPMEALQIAIARGDFEVALEAADEALQNVGPIAFAAERGLTRPPISILAQAELQFLRGVALAGMNQDKAAMLRGALHTIESAIGVVQRLAEPMDEPERSVFLDHISSWRGTADLIREEPTLLEDERD